MIFYYIIVKNYLNSSPTLIFDLCNASAIATILWLIIRRFMARLVTKNLLEDNEGGFSVSLAMAALTLSILSVRFDNST